MRFAWLKYAFIAAILCMTAQAQTNPHTGIRWPANCNHDNYQTYNWLLNSCIFVGPIGPEGQVQFSHNGAFGSDGVFLYNITSHQLSVPNLSVSGNALINLLSSQIHWPSPCNGVYAPTSNTCVPPGTAANPAGSVGDTQANFGGTFGAVSSTASMETNIQTGYQQPATGMSTFNGILCVGDSTSGNECTWLMEATGSTATTYHPTGQVAFAGDVAADQSNRLFSAFSPGPLQNPAVFMKIGTNDALVYGYVGDGQGGTGTANGYLKYTDSIATFVSLTPQEKRPTALFGYTVPKVIMTGTTVTIEIEQQRYASENLAVNMPILLNGFTTNTGLNGKVWHIQSRTDIASWATQLTLYETCSSGCPGATGETGTITNGWWPTNSGFTQDTSLGTGESRNSGNASLSTTASGSSISTPAASSIDSMWIGPSGMMFVWYYTFNGGTGSFQVLVNGVAQTDYFSGSTTISNNSGTNPLRNQTGLSTPGVAVAIFTGLPGDTYAQVTINAVNASAGVGKVGIVSVGSPFWMDTGGGAIGSSPGVVWAPSQWTCRKSVCGGGGLLTVDFYATVALAEATRLGKKISQGGWGFNVRPVDIRAEGNQSWDFVNPSLPGGQDTTHSLQIPGHINQFRAYARALGFSGTGGNGASWVINTVGLNNFQLSCNVAEVLYNNVTSGILPSCFPGKLIWVLNNTASASAGVNLVLKSGSGATVATLSNGQGGMFLNINPGNWIPMGAFQGNAGYGSLNRLVQGHVAGACSAIGWNTMYGEYECQGGSFNINGVFGASTPQPGHMLWIKNWSTTANLTLSGMTTPNDVPTTLYPNQAMLISTYGNNAWLKLSGPGAYTGTATLAAGTVTVTAPILSTASVVMSYQNCSACGTLYLGTITAGTSFVINSTNGSDASKVYWEVR